MPTWPVLGVRPLEAWMFVRVNICSPVTVKTFTRRRLSSDVFKVFRKFLEGSRLRLALICETLHISHNRNLTCRFQSEFYTKFIIHQIISEDIFQR